MQRCKNDSMADEKAAEAAFSSVTRKNNNTQTQN